MFQYLSISVVFGYGVLRVLAIIFCVLLAADMCRLSFPFVLGQVPQVPSGLWVTLGRRCGVGAMLGLNPSGVLVLPTVTNETPVSGKQYNKYHVIRRRRKSPSPLLAETPTC